MGNFVVSRDLGIELSMDKSVFLKVFLSEALILMGDYQKPKQNTAY